ncbi:MAG: glycosyltransferase family 9 protein [Verrucomicrobiota bacterium]
MIVLPPKAKIVLVRPDRIGDVVITSTCFAFFKNKFPSANIYFAAEERMQCLFEKTPSLRDFIPLAGSAEREKKFAHILREFQPDAVIHFHPDAACYCAAAQAGIPIRIGWRKRFLSKFLTHAFEDIRHEGKQHEALYNFHLLQALGIQSPQELKLEISPALSAQENLKRKLPWSINKTAYAVIHPTSAREIRRWPAERFAEIARWLFQERGLQIISLGANDDASQAFAVVTQDIPVVHLENKLNLAETAWLLRFAKLLISCDSGPSHIAAAVNCPQVMIFGRNEPAYGPTRWKALSDRAIILSPAIPRKFLESKRSFWKRGFLSISTQTIKNSLKDFIFD